MSSKFKLKILIHNYQKLHHVLTAHLQNFVHLKCLISCALTSKATFISYDGNQWTKKIFYYLFMYKILMINLQRLVKSFRRYEGKNYTSISME